MTYRPHILIYQIDSDQWLKVDIQQCSQQKGGLLMNWRKTIYLPSFPRVWRMYASMKRVIIGFGDVVPPKRRSIITWTNAGKLLIWTLRNIFHWHFNRNSNIFVHEYAFENSICKIASMLSRFRWGNSWDHAVWVQKYMPYRVGVWPSLTRHRTKHDILFS